VAKKKKSKKKKSSTPGVDVNEQRRERLEARRRAKAEEQARRLKAERRRKLVTRTALLAGLGAVVWVLFLRPTSGPTEIEGHQVLSFRNFGSNEHTGSPVNYESSPAVSGPHASNWRCGVFAEPLPDENQVHNLEHGAVGLLYRPDDVALEDIRTMESMVTEKGDHMFSSPYPEMETAIAVTGWSRMMRLDEFDESAIRKFIDAFWKKGPEKNDCDLDSSSPYEAPEPAATPTTAPSPSPSQ
jgi:hypothetical protein